MADGTARPTTKKSRKPRGPMKVKPTFVVYTADLNDDGEPVIDVKGMTKDGGEALDLMDQYKDDGAKYHRHMPEVAA